MKYEINLSSIVESARKNIENTKISDWALKTAPDSWSKKEILGHLIDSAFNNHQRFIQAIEQNDLIFGGYNQVEWVSRNNYQEREEATLVHLWQEVNLHLAELWKNIPEEVWQRKSETHNFHQICMNRIDEKAVPCLQYLAWDYCFHLEHHLAQIIPEFAKRLPAYEQ